MAPQGAESKDRIQEIAVPDIGDFKDIPVIEVLVKPGDTIAKEAPLVVLESDKASMEVPSSAAGVVNDVKVKVGDKVSQGSVIVTVAVAGAAPAKQELGSGPSTTAVPAHAQDDNGGGPCSSAERGVRSEHNSRYERRLRHVRVLPFMRVRRFGGLRGSWASTSTG